MKSISGGKKLGYGFTSPFVFDSRQSILKSKDLGIVNGHMAIGVPDESVCAVAGLYAPPYVSSNFYMDVRFMGETVRPESYVWLPNAICREGSVNGVAVTALTALGDGMRSGVIQCRLQNTTSSRQNVPVQIRLGGGLDYSHDWGFSKPTGTKAGDLRTQLHEISLVNNDKAWRIYCSLPDMRHFVLAGLWEGNVALEPGGESTFYLALSLGPVQQTESEIEKIRSDPKAVVQSAFDWLSRRTEELFSTLPAFSCSDRQVEHYYNRSLVHYITNTWYVDEFALQPYLSTGSINGGCVCSYLWDYSGGWELHPLVCKELDKATILHYLHCDLSRSFAFMPVHGQPFGPWYPVNQEKIVTLIYYYVKHTGDTAFLSEKVQGSTVLEKVIQQALFNDRLDLPGSLYDFGVDGEHHLELRRGVPYHGVLPDLNARRYLCCTYAYELSAVAGQPCEPLLERAAALKKLLRQRLWDENAKWFRFVSEGREDLRYTVQMFKLIDSPVLDEDMLEGLLTHLNEREFLSPFGLHSMSKEDAAYDQVDIDNGGGGICTLFVPLIAEKLFAVGRPSQANDLLRRTLWWGERVPYWGDSFVANAIDYRQDTPLQCTIGAVAGAQAILFGAFGIRVGFDGSVTVNPPAEHLAKDMKLTGVQLRGKIFDVQLGEDCFTVCWNGRTIQNTYGNPIVLK